MVSWRPRPVLPNGRCPKTEPLCSCPSSVSQKYVPNGRKCPSPLCPRPLAIVPKPNLCDPVPGLVSLKMLCLARVFPRSWTLCVPELVSLNMLCPACMCPLEFVSRFVIVFDQFIDWYRYMRQRVMEIVGKEEGSWNTTAILQNEGWEKGFIVPKYRSAYFCHLCKCQWLQCTEIRQLIGSLIDTQNCVSVNGCNALK